VVFVAACFYQSKIMIITRMSEVLKHYPMLKCIRMQHLQTCRSFWPYLDLIKTT